MLINLAYFKKNTELLTSKLTTGCSAVNFCRNSVNVLKIIDWVIVSFVDRTPNDKRNLTLMPTPVNWSTEGTLLCEPEPLSLSAPPSPSS